MLSVVVNDDARLIEIATRNHHLLTTELVRRTVTPGRWARLQDAGLWLEVTPGHYRHAATRLTFEMQVRAGAEWLGKDAALFGATALRWLAVDIPEPSVAEFLLPRSRTSVAHWMSIHTSRRWDARDVINHEGVRTSSGTRAVIDLASVETSAINLENAIDGAIRARRTALPLICRRMSALSGPGRTGSALLRELLLDSGGESHLERRFMRLVRSRGFPKPQCQVAFRAHTGRPVRVDFMFPGVVVEVTGRLGHTSDSDRQRDARRRNLLQQQGLVVLEFTTADVIDAPDEVVATLRTSIPISSSRRTGRAPTITDGGDSTTGC